MCIKVVMICFPCHLKTRGFENLIQQYNQQAAMASLEHSHHYLDMVLEATNGAGGSGAKELDLDLDLGIAPPSEGDSKCRIAGTYCNGQSPAVCRPDGATHFKIFCRFLASQMLLQ
ncbi:hypothetical protein SAY86_026779 [Trapa natans]|uniref:Uncharacterized protein n=1 Tax=Trapa natans TaxID=22666 RepID=A0AAN7KIF0_TRANT|nr:hypothetical protein SAY86_026779 [Trapa natans]